MNGSKADRALAWFGFGMGLLALVFVVLHTIRYSRETGYNARRLEECGEDAATLREEMQGDMRELRGEVAVYRVYIETLRTAMDARGIEVPPLPPPPPRREPTDNKGE